MLKLGLLGEKLGHSFSPLIHQKLLAHLGLEGTYDLIEISAADFSIEASKLHELYDGINVTIPYKVSVLPLLAAVVPEAAAIGAVNTIDYQNGKGIGYNTDYFGFGKMLNYNDIEVARQKVTVLGNGGAAKAVVKYLLDQGAEQISIVARDVAKAKKLFMNSVYAKVCFQTAAEFEQSRGGYLLVNCTPVGMSPKVGISPVKRECLTDYKVAVDLIYNPLETEFLREARLAGLQTVNGLFMLVAQAVAAEEIWLERRFENEVIAQITQELSEIIEAK